MLARSPHEAHRTATPLELLFDLVFVVAIAQAANGLHHAIAEAHAFQGLVGYLMVFFAIWWGLAVRVSDPHDTRAACSDVGRGRRPNNVAPASHC